MKLSSAFRLRSLVGVTSVALLAGIPAISQNSQPAQNGQAGQTPQSGSSSSSTDATVAKPLSAKELKKKQKALEKELQGPWKKWMNEDVLYIITDEEKQAFKQL